jgi:hypothetical protein
MSDEEVINEAGEAAVKAWRALCKENEPAVKEWLALRKEAGLKIDPETAEVCWSYVELSDPYGIYPERPDGYRCIGRDYFARAPGSDIWVWVGDLPKATDDALRGKLCHKWVPV